MIVLSAVRSSLRTPVASATSTRSQRRMNSPVSTTPGIPRIRRSSPGASAISPHATS